MTPSREYMRFTREAKEALVSNYKWAMDHGLTPDETVCLLQDEIGSEAAAEIIAVMVLCKGEWDMRISSGSRKWARATAEHNESELAQIPSLYYCNAIHPAHMEQIVNALRRSAVK